ncbi:MAG: DNA-directed RNA polymerase subunit omega [Acidobacteria bacterium]|nr:DNA-directed RNA polymerase subunit omega [Acidobacteriota bacterium]
MTKAAESVTSVESEEELGNGSPELDSKYRMIIVAAQRSKQIQRGARPRVEMDAQRHKPTRIALEEALRGKVEFSFTDPD